jgi:hypothetical protein
MPLTVHVGISRKASANYQSQGLSVNLTADLDQSLLADPPRLQLEIERDWHQTNQSTRWTRPTIALPKIPFRPSDHGGSLADLYP